jgi:hypothetical protein
MSVRCIALLAFLLAFAAGKPRAAELAFAHFAPGAGNVLVQVDELAPQVLAYKDYVDVARYPAGLRRLHALRSDGTLLAQGSFELHDNDRFVVILAGNGTAKAPYQWRLALDHNWVFIAGQSSLQYASLAILDVPGEPALQPLFAGVDCNGSNRESARGEAFGDGTRALAGTGTTGSLNIETDRAECVHYLLDPASPGARLAQATVSARAGDRLRRFIVGDGAVAPFELVIVNQGSETIHGTMAADHSIEGLWSIVGEPNTGLQVAFDDAAPAGSKISAVYFGFEADGRATWRTFERMRLVEYIGGNVDGTRAAVGFDRALAFITPHSCTDMSMVVMPETGAPAGHIFAPPPRNTVRLQRLFPAACPPPAPRAQEQVP